MAKKLFMLFPVGVITILTLVGILSQSWFFLFFNFLGIGLSWLFILVSESIPYKITNITAVLLITLSGLLILNIALSVGPEMKVSGVVVDSTWSGRDDDMNDTYDLLIKYKVENKVYHATVISYSEGTLGENYILTVQKNNPGKTSVFSSISGIIVGSFYLVFSAVIVFFVMFHNVKKRRKQLQ